MSSAGGGAAGGGAAGAGAASAAARSRLIAPEALAGRLGEPGLAVLELSAYDAPARFADAGHVPGARWAAWQELLWDPRERALADAAVVRERLAVLGIAAGGTLVVYGDPLQFGAYGFWALDAIGHPDVLLLDGGARAWEAAGLELERGSGANGAARGADDADGGADEATRGADDAIWRPRAEAAAAIGRDELRELLETPGWALLDLRSDEEFSGARVSPVELGFDHGAQRAGRIPGARHLPFQQLLGGDGRFRPEAALRAAFAAAGVRDGEPVVTYCRLGHRAAVGWFALRELLGVRDARVYDGSWTEWGSLVGAPVER